MSNTPSNTSRRLAMASGPALLGTTVLGGLSANAQIKPAVGGRFIKIDPSGVTVFGPMPKLI
ncbi:hypothetical protein [Reyranella soli]|jgi:hypothetical protein|uniref:Uncharacterized protein n=1 Tax=Reyranella soli TaxID=1230389 RepID=A0A512NDI0_9HYPH|nr:hypothetical protein [Reyranella soli]GEP57020.1 hypothetical protein RSO01_41860 [Reyranella soli]